MDHVLEPAEISLCKDCPDEEQPVDALAQAIKTPEKAKWSMSWRIDKYDGEVTPEMIAAGLKPAEVVNIEGNLLTTAGIQRLEDLLIGAGGQAFTAAHSRIGVGDSSTAATVADTDLNAASGSSHRQFVSTGLTVGRASQTISWVATFTTGEGNFAWNEFCIDQGTADGTTVTAVMLNHKVISAGTKTSAQTWVATATLVVS